MAQGFLCNILDFVDRKVGRSFTETRTKAWTQRVEDGFKMPIPAYADDEVIAIAKNIVVAVNRQLNRWFSLP